MYSRDFRRNAGAFSLDRPVLDPVEDVFRIRVERPLETIDVARPPFVRRLVPIGIPNEDELLVPG